MISRRRFLNRRRFGAAAAGGLLLGILFNPGAFLPSGSAQEPRDIELFQGLVGSWEGEGHLEFTEQGNVIPVRESWEGKFDDRDHFLATGDRMLGEQMQTFSWDYFFSPSVELLQVIYQVSDSEGDQIWGVSLDEGNGTIELATDLDDQTRITLFITLKGDEIEMGVTLVNSSGTTVATGEVSYQRTS